MCEKGHVDIETHAARQLRNWGVGILWVTVLSHDLLSVPSKYPPLQ